MVLAVEQRKPAYTVILYIHTPTKCLCKHLVGAGFQVLPRCSVISVFSFTLRPSA